MRISLTKSKVSMRSSLLFSFFFVTILFITSSFSVILIPHAYFYANGAYTKAVPAASGPIINDPNLKAELVFKGQNTDKYGVFGP